MVHYSSPFTLITNVIDFILVNLLVLLTPLISYLLIYV